VSTVSVKDVAQRAGVSLGTVSNVLNRPETVKATTRERVERAIAELGFVRNESARHLRGGHSRMIAYLMLDQSNPFFTDLTRGIEEVAKANHLAVFLCNSDQDPQREDEYLSLVLEQRIRGVLITAVDFDNERLRLLPARGIPVVFVDRPPVPDGDWCSVGVDDIEGGNLAAAHLLDQGHRRIAFVGGPAIIPQVADRHVGALRATEGAGLDADALTVLDTTNLGVAEGRRAGARLLGLPAQRRPTGVFCANDLLALGFLQEMTQQGVVIPEEIGIVGYDDIEFAAAAAIPLTSVRQPRALLGSTAAELLIDEANSNGEHVHRQIQFTPELIVRSSSRVFGHLRQPTESLHE
jgi:LacI family transcriptional regulator